MVCILLQLLVVSVVEAFQLFLDGVPLPPAYGTTAGVLLLLFHLTKHGVFLYLDERLALVLAEAEPELLDALPFVLGGRIPDLLP